MGKLMDTVVKNKGGLYMHVVEVSSEAAAKSLLESSFRTFTDEGFGNDDVRDFLDSLTIMFIPDNELDDFENKENEQELDEFDQEDFINNLV